MSGSTERRRSSPQTRVAVSQPKRILTLGVAVAAALGVVQFYNPPHGIFDRGTVSSAQAATTPIATMTANAFGTSNDVRVRFALPGESLEYPLAVTHADPRDLAYDWMRVGDSATVGLARQLAGASVVVPADPGFYRLVLLDGDRHLVMNDLTIGVMVPFAAKMGSSLNGYEIGTYLSERFGGSVHRDRPEGFVQITPSLANLKISEHLRLGDFMVHDDQQSWPKYAAVSPRLLDKIELVYAELARWRGNDTTLDLHLDVHSGFRSPSHNSTVRWAARDSRHQYGDAADVTLDADGDGRLTLKDSYLIAAAVEMVEQAHPDLVGGMGLYTSGRYRTPYVHIDARGKRARWRG